MGATLDPRKAHLVRQHGDIIAIYTWVNDERALVLIPAHRKPGSPWFVVCESAAYRYDNPHYLAKQARKAAEVIGMDETQAAWFKIASIIIEGLGDLIRMPSAPEKELMSASIGHMEIREDGELMTGRDIVLEKDEPEYA
ncbi:MAG: hypothetical protein KAY22_27500 [Rhizorhabdus sp.]|uniref:hypothetical protein n=1 Tax=Rhizorhabdus sp. TaxID=1968843 RepID=UPI001B5FACD4|nr:hypothetical protein [Rhizorhabdus sp.]MBP8236038.1 hypothetical protein [Rhizorhabdus sp.]